MPLPDLEIDLLRAFVAVADGGSFTMAANVVGRSQSAVSQKILRLEELVGHRVFERTSRSLSLTREGEQLLASARRLLELNDDVMRSLRVPAPSGSLRLGISEDFVPLQLPGLLARFLALHPGIQLCLTTGLSCDLLSAYDGGDVDVVIAKKDGEAQRGRVIWREPLEWIAAASYQLDLARPLSLVLLRPPCTYRELMLATLGSVGHDWTASCTASSLIGVQAAVSGGLGVTVLGRSFIQHGMQVLRMPDTWPPLPMTEITLVGEDAAKKPLTQPLVTFLLESLKAPAPAADKYN